MSAELREDCLADGDVLVNLGASRPLLLPDLGRLRHGLLLLRGGGVLEAGVGCRLSTLLLLGGGEDLARPLELLLRRLPITAGTPPLPPRSLREKLQSISCSTSILTKTTRPDANLYRSTDWAEQIRVKSRIKRKLLLK